MDEQRDKEAQQFGQEDGFFAPSMQQALHDAHAIRSQYKGEALHVLPKAAQALHHIALPPHPQLLPSCACTVQCLNA